MEVASGDGAFGGIFLYFNAVTGSQYPSWVTSVGLSQLASFSPDTHWRVSDSGYRVWEGEPYASSQHYEHFYRVLNFYTNEYYLLYGGADQILEWAGWTADSGTFYFISRPSGANAIAGTELPFGLLALTPSSHKLQMLFEQALFARLNPERDKACVIFPARRPDGKVGLDIGVFDLASRSLGGRQAVAGGIDYPTITDDYWIPTGWSDAVRRTCPDW